MADVLGKVKEALGWFTADRKVEAQGRAEQEQSGTKPTEEHVDAKTDDVREQYGETPDESDNPDRLH